VLKELAYVVNSKLKYQGEWPNIKYSQNLILEGVYSIQKGQNPKNLQPPHFPHFGPPNIFAF